MSTIHEYAELLKQRKLSSVELTKQYLARIEKADAQIGSYITVCPDEALVLNTLLILCFFHQIILTNKEKRCIIIP